MELAIMVYCILMDVSQFCLAIVMLIGLVVLMIEKALLEDASSWGNNLVSWFSKKQNCVSLSTAEAEYIAAGSSYSQMVWMKQMLTEYNVTQNVMTLYCDNLSAISISKNPIQQRRTKHIDIRHHFIRDLVEEKVIKLEHVATELQMARSEER